MEQHPAAGRLIETNRDATIIATDALLSVYESGKAEVTPDSLAGSLSQDYIYARSEVESVLKALCDKDNDPYLRTNADGRSIGFTTAGLWLIENAFMHGEDLDPIALAERILGNKFFQKLGT